MRRIDHLDVVFEKSTREAELLIGFTQPWVDRNLVNDPDYRNKEKLYLEAHKKFFADRGIEFEIFGPLLKSGFIMGGNVYWADCFDRPDVIAEYEAEFEVNGVSKEPHIYKAVFLSKSLWEKEYKDEWEKFKTLGSEQYFKELWGEDGP